MKIFSAIFVIKKISFPMRENKIFRKTPGDAKMFLNQTLDVSICCSAFVKLLKQTQIPSRITRTQPISLESSLTLHKSSLTS